MALNCTVCVHPERRKIDAALLAGVGVRDVAGRFDLSKSAVDRHRDHVSKRMLKSAKVAEIADADSLVDQVAELVTNGQLILYKALNAEDHATALAAMRELRPTYELLAKLTGELQAGHTTVNVLAFAARDWPQVQALIVRTLEPFPEARRAVAAALRAHDEG